MSEPPLDIVVFPDPIVEVRKFLLQEVVGQVAISERVPADYRRHILLRADTVEPNMVTRRTRYVIECRVKDDGDDSTDAIDLLEEVARLLAAWARSGRDNSPFRWELNSMTPDYPDPDDGTPRSILTCTLSWSPTRS